MSAESRQKNADYVLYAFEIPLSAKWQTFAVSK